MKRACAFLSALCLLITFLPVAVTAETYENLTYSVSDGQAIITDCDTSATGALTIPETIAGYPVTSIGVSAFADCAGLTAITRLLPGSLLFRNHPVSARSRDNRVSGAMGATGRN